MLSGSLCVLRHQEISANLLHTFDLLVASLAVWFAAFALCKLLDSLLVSNGPAIPTCAI